ncbi:hypothetical protein E5221_28655 [Pseudomonas sp. A2]|nr:hypothetical protein E5221_28655 [Pseudomonas sp. A2]
MCHSFFDRPQGPFRGHARTHRLDTGFSNCGAPCGSWLAGDGPQSGPGNLKPEAARESIPPTPLP